MVNINEILYKYILRKYGSVSDFSESSGIPLIELNAILIKEHISLNISSALKLCKKLNINIEKLVFDGEIEIVDLLPKKPDLNYPDAVYEPKKMNDENYKDNSVYVNELRDRFMRLSEIEKKEVLEFVNTICERQENL